MDASKSPRLQSGLAGRADNKRTFLSSAVVIVLFGATILGANLGGSRVLTYHETLFAQPAREMLQSGNWIVPTMGGIPSCHKPPVTYWVLAASMAIFQSGSELVVRLPILVASILTALLMAWATCRWHGERAGLWAGLVQLSTFYVLMQGRLAESDMLFCLAVTAAMVVFAVSVVECESGRWQGVWRAWLFYFLVGIAFLIKGPLGVAMIGGAVSLFVLVWRSRDGLLFLLSPTGWTIAALVGLSWPVAAYLQYPTIVDDWYMHNIGRFNGAIGGQKPPMFYFYITPLMLLPWTPFVIDGIARNWKTERSRGWWPLLACWFCAGFMLLSASEWKHKHYLIPLLPPFAVLAGVSLAGYQAATAVHWIRSYYRPLGGLLVLASVAAGITCHWIRPDLSTAFAVVLAVICVGLMSVLMLEARGKRSWQPMVLMATTWLAAIGVHFGLMPHFDSYRDQTLFAQKINKRVGNDSLHLVALPENQITYYLDVPLHRLDDAKTFTDQIADAPDVRFVLGPKYLNKMLATVAAVEVVEQSPTIRKIMTEEERLTLFRVTPNKTASRVTAKSIH